MSTVLIGGFFLLLALSVPIGFAMGLATRGLFCRRTLCTSFSRNGWVPIL